MRGSRRVFLGSASAGGAATAALLAAGAPALPFPRALLALSPAALDGAEDGLVQLPHGPLVRDPYASVAELPWWRGQLHTHTSRSFDGDPTVPPGRRAELYRNAHYDFTVLTDHNRISSVAGDGRAGLLPSNGDANTRNAGKRARPFLAVPGVECTHPSAHLGVWLMGDAGERAVSGSAPVRPDLPAVERMERWSAAGALVCCNHPSHPAARLTPEQMASWAAAEVPFRFVEVFNTLATTSPEALAYTAEVWRRAITAAGPDRPVWGVATDDSHGQAVGQGWIAVAARSLSPGALREALLAGRFYGSSGLPFSVLGADPEVGGIRVTAPGAAAIRFVGDDGRVAQQTAGDSAVFRPGGGLRWVRAEASDSVGRMAWSQPFWLDA